MTASSPPAAGATSSHVDAAASRVEIPQYSILGVLAVWAAAALPMGALAWLVAPAIDDHFSGEANVPLVKALLLLLTAGLIWQFVLVVILVRREQGTLRWPVVREALWLRSPQDPNSGRRGGRVWLGFLLPRMNGAFGRFDRLANGVLFSAYHLHEPWVFLSPLVDAVALAYPTKRYRSAWDRDRRPQRAERRDRDRRPGVRRLGGQPDAPAALQSWASVRWRGG